MNKNNEIEKKLKRVQWIRTVINHHLDDVEKILNDAKSICSQLTQKGDGLPKYAKWNTYRDVIDHISWEKNSPVIFAKMVAKMLYAMSKNGISREEANGVIDKLNPAMTHDVTVKTMKGLLDSFYPTIQPTKSLTDNAWDVDDKDLFGDDLGMP